MLFPLEKPDFSVRFSGDEALKQKAKSCIEKFIKLRAVRKQMNYYGAFRWKLREKGIDGSQGSDTFSSSLKKQADAYILAETRFCQHLDLILKVLGNCAYFGEPSSRFMQQGRLYEWQTKPFFDSLDPTLEYLSHYAKREDWWSHAEGVTGKDVLYFWREANKYKAIVQEMIQLRDSIMVDLRPLMM